MPRVSEFFGLVVYLYFEDHNPPHFHVFYGEFEAEIAIETLEVLNGDLPRRALGLVLEWASLRRTELRRAWEQAALPGPIDPIEPLD